VGWLAAKERVCDLLSLEEGSLRITIVGAVVEGKGAGPASFPCSDRAIGQQPELPHKGVIH